MRTIGMIILSEQECDSLAQETQAELAETAQIIEYHKQKTDNLLTSNEEGHNLIDSLHTEITVLVLNNQKSERKLVRARVWNRVWATCAAFGGVVIYLLAK